MMASHALRTRLLCAFAVAALALSSAVTKVHAAPPGKAASVLVFASAGSTVFDPLRFGLRVATLQLPPGEYLLQAKFWYLTTDPAENVLFCKFEDARNTFPDAFTLRDIMTVAADTNARMAVMVGAVVNNSNTDLGVYVVCNGPPQLSLAHIRFVATLAEVEVQP